MQRARYIVLGAVVLIVLGSLAGTIGYARYLRSDAYRQSCAQYLSQALGLPSDIGAVVPRSRTAREFDNVTVWLPERRGKALDCRRALVLYTPRQDDPHAYELELRGGTCEISTRTWLRADYRRMIESGLRPGFDPAGPQRVRFTDMDLHFERAQFRGFLEGASGVVSFDDRDSGWAAATCRALNGYVASTPAALHARFSPVDRGVRIDAVELTVPNLPLSVLGLRELLGVDVRSGSFNGRLAYSEPDAARRLTLSGLVSDLSLAECTAGLTTTPWRGLGSELELEELTLVNARPQRLRFRGVLTGVGLGDILAPLGVGNAGGELMLRIRDVDLSPDGIEHLIASGECRGLSLAGLTEKLPAGRASGRASLVIDDLTIEQNRLRSLEAEFRVGGEEPKWIEGRLITTLLGHLLNLQIPPVLPERIEYTQLGLRVEIHDEQLYLFGTHGSREKTILTLSVFGTEVPIPEPQQPYDLSAWFDALRATLRECLPTELDRLAATHGRLGTRNPAATEPASTSPADASGIEGGEPTSWPAPGERAP